MREFTAREIARVLGGLCEGDPSVALTSVRPLEEAVEGDLSILMDRHLSHRLTDCNASAVVVPFEIPNPGKNLIRVKDPRSSLILILELFYPNEPLAPGIHPTAFVSPGACLGSDVQIGAGSFIDSSARIGDRTRVFPNVYIGNSVIGDESCLFPNVAIYSGCRLGKRVVVHSGTVIGADGFGFLKEEEGGYQKIPQAGKVVIEDDVEIGANCAIDRATLGATRIRAGTKIDNLVQIGHNSRIGKNCCLVAQVGISGSVEIGDNCVLAGQVGVRDHVVLADGVSVGAKSGVARDLEEGVWFGYFAVPARRGYRAYSMIEKLPEMQQRVRELERRCRRLEELLRDKRNEIEL